MVRLLFSAFIFMVEERNLHMERNLEKKLKRNIPLDYISVFITNLNMQNSIWVLYLAYCGLNMAEIGVVEGIYHATSIIFEIPSGAVADLLGRKRSMVCSRVCTAISCVVMLFSKSFWWFAAGFAIQALGNNLNSGSEEALVYDSMKCVGQEEGYLKVCGRLDLVLEVSQGIATVLGGILAEYSYFWCYSACLVIALLTLLPVLLMAEAPSGESAVPVSERQEMGASKEGQERTGCGKKQGAIYFGTCKETARDVVRQHFRVSGQILKSDIRIFKTIVYYSVVFAAETLLFFYSQQYYFGLGYNKVSISFILLAVGGASCLGAAFSERFFRNWGPKTVTAAAVAIASALICYGFQNMPLSVAAFTAAGFFNSVLFPIKSDALNQLIPSGQRATLISVDSMFFSVAMIVLFPAAGAMADIWGLAAVLAGIGFALLVFVVCWNFAERRCSRDGDDKEPEE